MEPTIDMLLVRRVVTDLENLEKSRNLKETQSGNLRQNSKSQGKVREFCCPKFISAKLKILILKIFWGSMPPDTLNGLGITVELNLGLEKLGNFILSVSGNPG